MIINNITSSQHFLIRPAVSEDIPAIQEKNQKWNIAEGQSDKEHGYICGDTYSTEDLLQIVSANEVIVAVYKGKVIGYIINDNYSSLLAKYKKEIANLIQLGIIAPHLRVSKRTQAVVDKEYQRMGIPSLMMEALMPTLQAKYDLLFSRVSIGHPKRIAHEKAGWKFVHQDEEFSYCIFFLHHTQDDWCSQVQSAPNRLTS